MAFDVSAWKPAEREQKTFSATIHGGHEIKLTVQRMGLADQVGFVGGASEVDADFSVNPISHHGRQIIVSEKTRAIIAGLCQAQVSRESGEFIGPRDIAILLQDDSFAEMALEAFSYATDFEPDSKKKVEV